MTTRRIVGIGTLIIGILMGIVPILFLKISTLVPGVVDASFWVGYSVISFWLVGLGIHMVFGSDRRSITVVAFPVLTGEAIILSLGLMSYTMVTHQVPFPGLWLSAGVIWASAVYFCRRPRPVLSEDT